MKSIKPGRGPSMLGGIAAAFGTVFGIIWTIVAAAMGAPIFFPLFGICFVVLGVVHTAYHFKNAKSKNRYSVYDITDSDEEPDPLNRHFGNQPHDIDAPAAQAGFCPYCGAKADAGYAFCRKCGVKLPD